MAAIYGMASSIPDISRSSSPELRGLTRYVTLDEIQIDHVIEIHVEDEAMIERITGRYACSRCDTGYHDTYKKPKVEGVCDNCGGANFVRRKDDTPETVRLRLSAYHEQTKPIISHYGDQGILRVVDGMKAIDDVTKQIKGVIG